MLGLLRSTVYVKLHPDQLAARHVESGRTLLEPPLVAIAKDGRQKVLGVGSAATAASAVQPAQVVNPFKHPRTLISDFTVAEALLKGVLRKLFAGSLFTPAPLVILHPRIEPEGGFTQIEIRALREMAMGAGASRVIIWTGRDLTDEEARHQAFPASAGKVLPSRGPPSS
jgi:rod shape-determining protein MreB and related proteins